MRRILMLSALAAAVAVVPAAGPAQAKFNPRCASVRINQDRKLDKHGFFGAFGIRRAGTSCTAARKVAYRYVHNKKSIAQHPARILGWTCDYRSTDYQEAGVTCRKPGGKITFKYVIPGD